MTDLIFPSKRRRATSFANKHFEFSFEDHVVVTGVFPEKEIGQVQVKNFLDICRFCKKNLRQNSDVFMYGYFGAFCTKECRAKQMACDMFMESSRIIGKTKKGRTCETKPKDSRDESLGQAESIVPPQFYI